MSNNFWGFLIDAWSQALTVALYQLPDSHVNNVLAMGAITLNYALAPILFFVGPFFNLNFLAAVVLTMLAVEGIKLLFALGGLIKRLAEVAMFVIKLLPFLA